MTPEPFDLSTPRGRKAVEAAHPHLVCLPESIVQALAAALAVLMDDTCPTCEGRNARTNPLLSNICSCDPPGKVTAALVKPDEYRQEVIADVAAAVRDEYGGVFSSLERIAVVRKVADFIERRERER